MSRASVHPWLAEFLAWWWMPLPLVAQIVPICGRLMNAKSAPIVNAAVVLTDDAVS